MGNQKRTKKKITLKEETNKESGMTLIEVLKFPNRSHHPEAVTGTVSRRDHLRDHRLTLGPYSLLKRC